VVDEEKIPIDDEPKSEKPVGSGSGKKEGKKKRIKKIVYYESDTSSCSQKDNNSSSSKQKTIKTFITRILLNDSYNSHFSNA
jgi:hypothetical protein